MKPHFLLFCLALILFTSCSHEYVRPENYKNPLVRIDTEMGSMTFELFEDKVPNAVSHFIKLTENDFYKNMFFHMIVSDTLAQGGCPNTAPGAKGIIGKGNSGYFIKEEYHPDLRHDQKGVLSLARGYKEGTTGSQFVLMFDKLPVMDDNHTMIGRIIEGAGVLDLIEAAGSRNGKIKREIGFSIKLLSKNDIEYFVEKIEK
jgi:cyclophilin family peptidyl-prolyl cis-trans isomerase